MSKPLEIKEVGVEITKCPIKEVTLQSWNYIKGYNFFKNGLFPENTGWLNQGAKFLEAIGLIEIYKEELCRTNN